MNGVVLRDNWVLWNNAGRGKAGAKGECAGHPPVPADCGGGIHLVWTSNSTVENNIVAYNADGILLTDELGPTSHNTIRGNRVLNNLFECGIVLAGHSPKAVGPRRQDDRPGGRVRQPDREEPRPQQRRLAERRRRARRRRRPRYAVYDNTISGNTIDHNWHSGVTVHQHVAGYLGGNRIVDNTIGTNNSLGDDDFAAAQDMQTTGILVASGSPPGPPLPPPLVPSPIPGTVITGNTISGDAVGIWTLNAPGDYGSNAFGTDVQTQVSSR